MKRKYDIPLINSNGNNPRKLIKQIQKVYHLVEEAKNEINKLDMYDGRNSIDRKHAVALREDKYIQSAKLIEVSEYLKSVLQGINKQIRHERNKI